MTKHRFAACAALACFAFASAGALAQDHSYSEGPVQLVTKIRTVDGHFDDYMKFLATTYKKEEEAAKKLGYIVGYDVVQLNPQGPNDPDLLLIITLKNFAALDGALAKADTISKQFEGSVANANKATGERNQIRRILGTEVGQVLELK
jgi:hypothetical protein